MRRIVAHRVCSSSSSSSSLVGKPGSNSALSNHSVPVQCSYDLTISRNRVAVWSFAIAKGWSGCGFRYSADVYVGSATTAAPRVHLATLVGWWRLIYVTQTAKQDNFRVCSRCDESVVWLECEMPDWQNHTQPHQHASSNAQLLQGCTRPSISRCTRRLG